MSEIRQDQATKRRDIIWRRASRLWRACAVVGLVSAVAGSCLIGWIVFDMIANLPPLGQTPISHDPDDLNAVGWISLMVIADGLCWVKLVRSGTLGWLWGVLWTLPNLWYLAATQGLPLSISDAANWPLITFVLLLGTQVWLVWEAYRLREV